MRDDACVRFLQECLPRIGLQWRGYRKVRKIVCKRIRRRMRNLSLAAYGEYRDYLDANPEEWDRLAEFCWIPVSRFYRDRAVFDLLGGMVLPHLAEQARQRGDATVSVWSVGCASGEEPYTIAILWTLLTASEFPDVALRVLATDAEPAMIERAKRGCYRKSSLKEAPEDWIAQAFQQQNGECCVEERFRRAVAFEVSDLRSDLPGGTFDLILCRNLAFTYFSPENQIKAAAELSQRLRPGGFLVLGSHEKLPAREDGYCPVESLPVYERTGPGTEKAASP